MRGHRLTAEMRRPDRFGFAFITRAAMAILMLIPTVAIAQDVTEPALKAAYIYNFVKFTEWAQDMPATDPLVMCILGDEAVTRALERAVVGRVIAGHPVVSMPIAAAATKRACHVLYVSGVSAAQAGDLVADVRDMPILTISDIEGFTKVGGIVHLFFEHGQLRFRINLLSTKRAKLQISSKLLIMARPND
jgi:hypothetical protein